MQDVQTRKFLFVAGCPRSGTTAMGNFLAANSQIVMGIERYGRRMFPSNFTLTRDLYEKERFMTIEPGDTFYKDLGFAADAYKDLDAKFETALWVGDKIPKLYESLDKLFEEFPEDTRVVFLFRNIFDVSASYNRRLQNPNDRWTHGTGEAIRDWNRAITAYKTSSHKDKIIPIVYEEFFAHEARYLALCDWLGIAVDDAFHAILRNIIARNAQREEARERDLSEADVFEISMKANFGGYREIVKASRQVLAGDVS